MKAADLMIGDWVRQKHSGLKLQVSEIRPPYISAESEEGQFHEDTIEPIPLTPEILAKNADKIDRIYQFGKYPKIMNVMYDSGARARIMEGEDEYYGIELKYVHKLQHALWLYEITEKRIKI